MTVSAASEHIRPGRGPVRPAKAERAQKVQSGAVHTPVEEQATRALRWWSHPALAAGHAASLLVIAFLDYVIGMVLVLRAVPAVTAAAAAALGVNLHSSTLPAYTVWAMSSLAGVVLVSALGLVLMVALWRARRRALGWLHGRIASRPTSARPSMGVARREKASFRAPAGKPAAR